jgi:poly-beta-1,6-N-acetyl-D-glucosamine N-deacetylase PgaB
MRGAILLVLLLALAPAHAEGTRFTAIAFHDVVDSARELEGDAITTDNLVGFLEWLKASGAQAVTLDDIDAARRGARPLPDRAILITFDDGYRSLYTRVFPLLLAYRVPAVAALVGAWMDAPMDATVRYGDADAPRGKFISWAQAREMADSGLVEFASHGYALHRTVRADPQGSREPAALAPIYDPAGGYETHAQFRSRIAADLAKSRALMHERLGKAPVMSSGKPLPGSSCVA